MGTLRWPRLRFSLTNMFVLVLGIAIGIAFKSSLSMQALGWLLGPGPVAFPGPGPYVVEPPDVLNIAIANVGPAQGLGVEGQHLVGPDGAINLGTHGRVQVSGLTLAEATDAVEKALQRQGVNARVAVDVVAYNSKVYYVVLQSRNRGDQVARHAVTGNETVIDALAQSGVARLSKAKVWVSRPAANGNAGQTLPVDWQGISVDGDTSTNWQLLPGDRLFVSQ